MGTKLDVFAITANGKLWHSIRGTGWQEFGDVGATLGAPNMVFRRVAAVTVGVDVHVVVIDGGTIRYPNRWQPFLGNIASVVGAPGAKFRRVSAGEANGTIHFCMTTEYNSLLHTARHAGKWPFKWTDIRAAWNRPRRASEGRWWRCRWRAGA